MNFYFLIFIFFFFSCQKESPLKEYFKNLPPTEKENQSILAEELFIADIKKKYNQKDYTNVLSSIENYYMTREGEEFNSETSFYFDRSIYHLTKDKKFGNYYSNQTKNKKFYYSFRKKKNFFYTNKFLKKIVSEKNNYSLEKKALSLYHDELLNSVSGKKKRNRFYFYFIRYPEIKIWQQYSNLISSKLLKMPKEKQNLVKKIVTIHFNNKQQKETKKVISYSKNIVVKNRTHVLFSRNLTTLEGWELMTFIGNSITNSEDGDRWQKIIFRNNQIGYISLEGQTNLITISNKNLISLYNHFYNKGYISNVSRSIDFYYDTKNEIEKELSIILTYQSLNEIAQRATSIENPYTLFAKEYPNYFFSTNLEKLEVGKGFFLLLYNLNKESPLLPYFNSYP